MSEIEELHDLTAAYLLDALDDRERLRFESHLAECPVCPGVLAELSVGVDRMLDAGASAPPVGLKERVMASITPATAPLAQPGQWKRWLAGTAAAIILVVGGWAVGRATAPQGIDGVIAAPDALTVTIDDATNLIYSEELGQGVLDISTLDEPPSDRDYQVWLIDETGPVSAAVVESPSIVLIAGDFAGSRSVAVSVEPDGGSPQPTTDPILVGEVQ